MKLSHAITVAATRSYLAALADQSVTLLGAIGYEQALLYLDVIHGDRVPALYPIADAAPDLLAKSALTTAARLTEHGIDPLQVELLISMISDARDEESRGEPAP